MSLRNSIYNRNKITLIWNKNKIKGRVRRGLFFLLQNPGWTLVLFLNSDFIKNAKKLLFDLPGNVSLSQ